MDCRTIELAIRYSPLVRYIIKCNLWTAVAMSYHSARLRNDLYCVGWGVKLYSIQSYHSALLHNSWLSQQINCQS